MLKGQMSTQSKKFKSKEWKERKRVKHEENAALRASLHKEKAHSSPEKRAEVQRRIDAIGSNT